MKKVEQENKLGYLIFQNFCLVFLYAFLFFNII